MTTTNPCTTAPDYFSREWSDGGFVILPDGSEIPVQDVLDTELNIFPIDGIGKGLRYRCSREPSPVYAKALYWWDETAGRYRVSFFAIGAYGGTLVARRFYSVAF